MEIYTPADHDATTAKSVIVQCMVDQEGWFTKIQQGVYKNCRIVLVSITDTASLNNAKVAHDAVTTNGGQFNERGYPPLTVSIEANKLVVYDDRKYNGKSVQCNLNKANYAVGTKKKCLDTASEKMHVTVIYWDDLINWRDQWKTFKLVVNWKPLGQNSRVYKILCRWHRG